MTNISFLGIPLFRYALALLRKEEVALVTVYHTQGRSWTSVFRAEGEPAMITSLFIEPK